MHSLCIHKLWVYMFYLCPGQFELTFRANNEQVRLRNCKLGRCITGHFSTYTVDGKVSSSLHNNHSGHHVTMLHEYRYYDL